MLRFPTTITSATALAAITSFGLLDDAGRESPIPLTENADMIY
jgi:hypothetical protein